MESGKTKTNNEPGGGKKKKKKKNIFNLTVFSKLSPEIMAALISQCAGGKTV